jgi:ParB-like chromosome segregation protein Spo0J
MSDVAPPERDPGQRMIEILNAIREGIFLPPVAVYEKLSPPYRYEVYDGYHRYYASAAAGLVDLIRRVNDLEAFFSDMLECNGDHRK